MKRYAIAAAYVVISLAVIAALVRLYTDARSEAQRQASNVESLTRQVRRFTVADSLHAATTQALRLRVSELESVRAADAATIAALQVRPKDVREIVTTVTEVRDTVIYLLRDSCIEYRDRWCDFRACLTDSTLTYTVRDSLTAIVHVEYQRRFLFFRWRPRYAATVVSRNPHSEAIAEAVVIER